MGYKEDKEDMIDSIMYAFKMISEITGVPKEYLGWVNGIIKEFEQCPKCGKYIDKKELVTWGMQCKECCGDNSIIELQ